MSERLQYDYDTKTILELCKLMEHGHLNLEPGFQRKSVWTISDRRRFIQSVLEGFPVPSIFLYSRTEDGEPMYDVLDGKQRLETLFMFMRVSPFGRDGFDVKFALEDEEELYYDWRALDKAGLRSAFLKYKLQVAEVSGDLADIVDLFVRINSTGKPLTSPEKRHAKFYTSPLLHEAQRLAKKQRNSLLAQHVITPGSIARMRDVELVSELMTSIIHGGPIDRKKAVDQAVSNSTLRGPTLKKTSAAFTSTANAVKAIFPDLKTTRFHNSAEYYTLFLLVREWQQAKLVLKDRQRRQTAMKLLSRFSNGVDEVRQRQRSARGAGTGQRLYSDYLLMVQQGTDKLSTRQRRMEILRGLFEGLFERKDEQRVFNVEQRRLLWNSDEKKQCKGCGVKLDWTNFEVDHVKPHSRGGKTNAKNAAILCRTCNASKGAKTKKKAVKKQGKAKK